MNVFVGLFTPMLIIKITEFSGCFNLPQLTEDQKQTFSHVKESNTQGNQMLIENQ